jgi:hypothetical protein
MATGQGAGHVVPDIRHPDNMRDDAAGAGLLGIGKSGLEFILGHARELLPAFGLACESAPNRDPPGSSAYCFDCTGNIGA